MKKTFIYTIPENKESILNEIDIMRQLDHPSVLKLNEVYEDSKHIHMLLPLLTGNELFMRMKQKNMFRESDAAKVMKNFLSALMYLQSKNIVHRDLKP